MAKYLIVILNHLYMLLHSLEEQIKSGKTGIKKANQTLQRKN